MLFRKEAVEARFSEVTVPEIASYQSYRYISLLFSGIAVAAIWLAMSAKVPTSIDFVATLGSIEKTTPNNSAIPATAQPSTKSGAHLQPTITVLVAADKVREIKVARVVSVQASFLDRSDPAPILGIVESISSTAFPLDELSESIKTYLISAARPSAKYVYVVIRLDCDISRYADCRTVTARNRFSGKVRLDRYLWEWIFARR